MNKYPIEIIYEQIDGFVDGDILRTNYNPFSDKFFRMIFRLGLKQMQSGYFNYWSAVYTVGKVAHVWFFESTPDGIQLKRYTETY